jgi:hypothetical protein
MDSALAEVEALTVHLENQQLSPTTEPSKKMCSLSSKALYGTPQPTARRKTEEGLLPKQPKPQPRSLPLTSKEGASKRSLLRDSRDDGRVLLRQSSWTSREQVVLAAHFSH